ncbi:aldehyde dehydrogenase family protein [candidate division KSB1 bacterium]|nr:aldehyde dehydrogenase family protein [candidate division KSB1 bacterium]
MNKESWLHPRHDKIESINPATLEVIGSVAVTPAGEVEEKVLLAREAFGSWRNTSLKYRAGILKKFSEHLFTKRQIFAELITREMGRPIVEALVLECEASIDLVNYYARRYRLLKPQKVRLHNPLFIRRKSYHQCLPLGVIGVICPWNWPLLIPLGCIVPALLAGNAVVFKPSEFTPLVGEEIASLLSEAGLPHGVFQIVQGYKETGKALVKTDVDKIFFTGSTQVGSQIMQAAAKNPTAVVLEMGGSDPAIVCNDANVEITASGLLWGGFSNCGQNCNSVERVFFEKDIAGPVMEALVRKTEFLKIGNGFNRNTDIGPLATKHQYEHIKTFIQQMIKKGAEIMTGGKEVENQDGYFFQPTVLKIPKDVTVNEEIFGPVIAVTIVDDIDEAVELANDTPYGLAASVWTADRAKGERIARRLQSGTTMINDAIVSFGMPEAGWTGIKKSGIGWVHGHKGLEEMVNIQYVNVDPQSHQQKFWWFPYDEETMLTMHAAMKFLYSTKLSERLIALPKVLSRLAGYILGNSKRADKY